MDEFLRENLWSCYRFRGTCIMKEVTSRSVAANTELEELLAWFSFEMFIRGDFLHELVFSMCELTLVSVVTLSTLYPVLAHLCLILRFFRQRG